MEIETYEDALLNGYTEADCKLQRGYISRRTDWRKLPVRVAGGRRKGQLYVLMPNWKSSMYVYRQYLTKKS